MVPARCPTDRHRSSRIGISDPKLATLVPVSDRNARREPAAGVAWIRIPRSPTHPASGRASSYPKAPVARGPYDRRENRPFVHAGRTHAQTHHTGGHHPTSINRRRKSDARLNPQIRGINRGWNRLAIRYAGPSGPVPAHRELPNPPATPDATPDRTSRAHPTRPVQGGTPPRGVTRAPLSPAHPGRSDDPPPGRTGSGREPS